MVLGTESSFQKKGEIMAETKKIICPKCEAKNTMIIGNKNKDSGDKWSIKEIKCCNPKCGRIIRFRVNGQGKVRVIIISQRLPIS